MRIQRGELEDFEKKDPLWWCEYHKNSLSLLVIRVNQYFDAETDEEKRVAKLLIDVLLKTFKDSDIGIVVPFTEVVKDGEIQ